MNIVVDPANITDRVGPHMYGSGIETYEHQMYGGFWSNMIYDDSFEDAAKGDLTMATTASWYRQAGNCTVNATPAALNGNQTLVLRTGCKVLNRGLVAAPTTSSMHFVGGQPYEGYLFWSAQSGVRQPDAGRVGVSGALLRISLLCTKIGDLQGADAESLGAVEMTLGASENNWTMANFSITPSVDCLQTASPPRMGLVSIELLGPTRSASGVGDSGLSVAIDKVMVEPGEWGRYKGLHVRRDLADTFLGQHPTIMRLGGSMTNAPGFRFKYMVGPPWSRPPTDSSWIRATSWGFGMFEFLQFAELANIYPVICVNFDEDMAGLLEYMYGDPVATAWGRQRAADGHSRPYTTNLTIVCSNEEPQQDSDGDFRGYITAFNRWIKSTRSAATALGVWPLSVGVAMASGAGRRFSPGNEDKFTGGSTEMLNAIFAAELGDAEVVWDQHGDGGVAAGWGDENRDWATILSLPNNQSMEALSKAGGKWVKAIMLEENGGGCGMGRALGHVSNALSLQRIGHQVAGQCAAGIWATGPAGMPSGDYQIKYLGDQIVVAPFWHAQRMLAESHQPNVCGGFHHIYSGTPGSKNLVFTDWMAAVSDDGSTVVIRVENPNPAEVNLNVQVEGGPWRAVANVTTLSASSLDAENDYATPNAVAPEQSTAGVHMAGHVEVMLPPFSFTVITLFRGL